MEKPADIDVIQFKGVDIQKLPREELLQALRFGYDELVLLRNAMSDKALEEAAREEEFQRDLRARHDYFGTVAEYQSRLMDSATAYNQIIILAGYVAFFGVWSAVKGDIPHWILRSSGGAMLVSLIVFIGWTVFGMFQLQTQNMKTLKTFEEGVDGFEGRFRAAVASGLQDTGWLHKCWTWIVLTSGSTGFVAASLLSYGTLASIFSAPETNSAQTGSIVAPVEPKSKREVKLIIPVTNANRTGVPKTAPH